jgi:hypothetical protein
VSLQTNVVLWSRDSLILMAIMLFDGFVDGQGRALIPIAAVNLFGFTTLAVFFFLLDEAAFANSRLLGLQCPSIK